MSTLKGRDWGCLEPARTFMIAGMAVHTTRNGLLGFLLTVAGCAGEDTLGRQMIRPGGEADFGRDAAPEAGPRDATVVDLGGADAEAAPPDEGPATAPVWYVVHQDDPATGVRAALSPPQAPVGDALAATWPAPVLVVWAGPDSPGDAQLEALLRSGRRPVAPLYQMAGRAAEVATDGSWLVARALQHPHALQVEGRPVLVVAPSPDRAGLSALRSRLALLGVDPYMVLEVPVDARPWPAADAILPTVAYGAPLDADGAPGAAVDAVRRRQAQDAAHAAGWAWLPRAGPAANARLTQPDAPLAGTGGVGDLTRSLVLARPARTPGLPVVVDGLGAWADDRQLDAVGGETTAEPTALTGGASYLAYGADRLATVAALLGRPGTVAPTTLWANPPILLSFSGAAAPQLAVDGEVLVVETVGAAEWVLDARPFRLPPGLTLRSSRSTAEVQVDLQFADGTRLSDRLPTDATVGEQAVPLHGFAGWVVEAVLVHAEGPGALTAPRLER